WTTKVPGTQANANLLFTNPGHALLLPLGLALAVGRLSPWGTRVLRGALWALFAVAVGDLAAHLVGWAQQAHVGMGLFSVGMSGLALAATRPPPMMARRRT